MAEVTGDVAQFLVVRQHLHFMAWLNFAQSQELGSAAYAFAEEIRDGKWKHVFDPKGKQVSHIPELIDELQRRCPGYTLDAYKRALADGMFASR